MASKTLVKLSGSERGPDRTASKVREVNREEKVTLTIGLSGPELPGPNVQKMSHKELTKKFGALPADVEKVEKYFQKKGFKVKKSSITRSMRVSGTLGAVEDTFGVKLSMMRSPTQGLYRGRRGPIKIPPKLEGIVTGVFGLDQRQMARPRSSAALFFGHRTWDKPLTPARIEKLYNFPPGKAEGQNIAIAQFGEAFFTEDIEKYCKRVSKRPLLPKMPKLRTVYPHRRPYTLKEFLNLRNHSQRKLILERSFEVMTDTEIIAGLCPKASISIYFSTYDQAGWLNLLERVINARPSPVVLSVSWGLAEDDKWWSKSAIRKINEYLNLARLLGITTCVASGDDGWRCGGTEDEPHVDFPSSSPHVLSVGGTMLKKSGGRYKEVAWNEKPITNLGKEKFGGGASGGGVSTIKELQRPGWQQIKQVKEESVYPKDDFVGRVVPDVSALAGEPYYDLIFMGYRWSQGQTSASAPVWAALIARVNAMLPLEKQQRFLTPFLYTEWKKGVTVGKYSCRDITEGNNEVSLEQPKYKLNSLGKCYRAHPGFDAVTGWGVPNGKKLLECLKKI